MNYSFLILIVLIGIVTTINYSESEKPIILSERIIYNENQNILATEKKYSDKTFSQIITEKSFKGKSWSDSIIFNNESIDRSSRVTSGTITMIISGGDSTKCKLYLVNDYTNSETLTENFTCNGTQTITLNERGLHILTTKINDGTAEFKVINEIGKSFDVDENNILLDITFKKPQYFAKLDENNIVTSVIVADEEFISRQSGNWIETWLDGGEKGNFAGIGFSYDGINDKFIPEKPYDSWVLNKSLWQWDPPIFYPDDENKYFWNESTQNWEDVK